MKSIQWNLNEENYQFGTANSNGTSVNVRGAEKANVKQVKNGAIYAGNVKSTSKNSAAGVKENAQKRALKKLVDQMVNDLKDDDVIAGYEERKEQASEDIQTRQKQLQSLSDAKEQMMEAYHLTEEDIDRTNFGLVRKSLMQPENLTEEEKNKLAEMPVSQRDILTCEVMQDIQQKEINNDNAIKKAAGKAIEDFKVLLLKDHPMVDAQEAASAIVEEAKQTVLGMLREEGTDKVDNDLKKNEEIQEKKEEEKKEEEKRTKKSSSQTEQSDMKDSVKDLQDIAKEHDKIQREVKNLMDKELLIDDDLKGLNLDELI